jgi:hypothetical protein
VSDSEKRGDNVCVQNFYQSDGRLITVYVSVRTTISVKVMISNNADELVIYYMTIDNMYDQHSPRGFKHTYCRTTHGRYSGVGRLTSAPGKLRKNVF